MHQFWKLGYMSFNTFFEWNMYVPDVKTSWRTYLRHYDLEMTLNLEILLLKIILGNYLQQDRCHRFWYRQGQYSE